MAVRLVRPAHRAGSGGAARQTLGGRSSRPVVVVLAALVGVVVASCGSAGTAATSVDALGDDAITVASFDFAESELLAELYSQALEAGGFTVERSYQLGSREIVLPALRRGLVELVPEYAGSALEFVSLGRGPVEAGTAAGHRALVDQLAGTPVRALEPAPAANTNAFVVTGATARRDGLRRLSDLARTSGSLTFGGPPECASRPLCLQGLERRYGVRFEEVLTLDVGGPVTRQALRNGDVDVALLFSTDPDLIGGELVELEDDQSLQPAENVTPLLRQEVVERWGPSVVDLLDEVSRRLTTEDLRAMNASVARGDADARSVATGWLRAEGLR